jgi:hypothetical protein
MMRTGYQPVIRIAREAGITSSLPAVPSLAWDQERSEYLTWLPLMLSLQIMAERFIRHFF